MRLVPASLWWVVGLAACGGAGTAPVGPPPTPPPPTLPPPPPAPPPAPTFDLDALGVPRFVSHDYVDLAMIQRISRFRSGVGHDYSDAREPCRSLKHYFMPFAGVDWGAVAIRAPVAGTITLVRQEWAGSQILIRSSVQPAFTVILFHVTPTNSVAPGTAVAAGQQLGWHVGSQTMSDVAVGVDTPTGYRLVSWFEVMTDALFASYQARGLTARSDVIISRAARDADPLSCAGQAFTSQGTLEHWVQLQ